MTQATKAKAVGYTVAEFIAAFRPDGMGHIVVECDGEVTDIAFDEILCDLCNRQISQPEEDPFRRVVFVLDDFALCEQCKERVEEETPLPGPQEE